MVERCLIEINLLCAFMFLVMFRCVLEFSVNNIKTSDLDPKQKKTRNKSLMMLLENIKFLTAKHSNCNVGYVLCFVYKFIVKVLLRYWIFFYLIIEYMRFFSSIFFKLYVAVCVGLC